MFHERLIGNLADAELEPPAIELLAQAGTLGNDIAVTVETQNPDLSAANPGEQMVQGEGEITLAAAEIDDRQLAARRQVVGHVVDEFEKPVDLTELGVLRGPHLA